MKLLDSKKKPVILNITPLIDVLFILIIFFTVSSTFLEQSGIKLSLPKASTAEVHNAEKAILFISSDAQIYFLQNKVTLQTLPNILSKDMQQRSEKSLIISADKQVNHGLVVTVMDIARSSGVQKLVISTKPE